MAATRTMYEWFTESARAYPEQPALSVEDIELSYADLHLASARVASEILKVSRGRPRRAGVIASRTLGTYVAYLAALRLGAAVVPLNSDFPVDRNRVIISAADLDVVLFPDQDSELVPMLTDQTGPRPLVLPDDAQLLASGDDDSAAYGEPFQASIDDIAYILFTSGSTGTPKGVPIRHSYVSAYLSHNIPYFSAGPGARTSQTTDLTFDLSVFAMFIAWGSGATVVVPSKVDLLEPARHVTEKGITHWLSVPSVVSLARQLQLLPPDSMPTLRWSLFAGEQLTTEQARAWLEAAPQSTVENVYGPTELTISCVSHRLPSDPQAWQTVNGTVPIGEPYPLVDCLVVDEDGRESHEGELLLRGAQRFDGYLDPALNVGRFGSWDGERFHIYDGVGELTPDHWYRSGDRVRVVDGQIFHLGRLDNQLKIRGYRIEPGDIEAALRAHPAVQDAIVVPCAAADGEADLAAAYTGQPTPAEELAEFVGQRLPGYMVPEFFVWMQTFPVNVNGKIDRPRLTAEAPDWTTQ
jgi:amino acid adenylation domain-containing protein